MGLIVEILSTTRLVTNYEKTDKQARSNAVPSVFCKNADRHDLALVAGHSGSRCRHELDADRGWA